MKLGNPVGGKIGVSQRQTMAKLGGTVPDPGAYTLPSTVGVGRKHTISERRLPKAGNNLPGPGSYSQKVPDPLCAEIAPRYTFARA